jgi:hypothetical protein
MERFNNEDNNDDERIIQPLMDWAIIPGWCMVTMKLTPDDSKKEWKNLKSTQQAVMFKISCGAKELASNGC